jgi:hypothetical protein
MSFVVYIKANSVTTYIKAFEIVIIWIPLLRRMQNQSVQNSRSI